MKRKPQFVFVLMTVGDSELPHARDLLVGVYRKLKSAKVAAQKNSHPKVKAETSWTQNQYRTHYRAIWNTHTLAEICKVQVMP